MGEYRDLANAVILQAVQDWRSASGTLKRNPRNAKAKSKLAECEQFFLSEWFKTLSDVDGKTILDRLREGL